MNPAAIIYRPTSEYIYPSSHDTLELQLITARADVEVVELLYWMRYETDPAKIQRQRMQVSLRNALRDFYRTTIQTDQIAAYTRYCFHFRTGDSELWLGAKGLQETEPAMNGNFYEFLWPNPTDGFSTPPWRNHQVYYQIFPERFKNGDTSITPHGAEPWGSPPTRENFMGGDLAGIAESLDYIQQLGATCLYLTPIFCSPSNHKYDTTNYFDIDPAFGTKEDLRKLVKSTHDRGMRIILDGVFNHCGYWWDKFQDVRLNGAASPYHNWFFINGYPVDAEHMNYDCVGHYKWMPKLNLANPNTREYFISVGRYWLQEFDIDGWRLDVADEMPTSFLEAFSVAMREIKPDCILLGETWSDAGQLVSGNRLDSAMNYLFRDAAVAWLAKGQISVSEFDHQLNTVLALYPVETSQRMYNLLDSHDTARFLYESGGDITRLMLAVAVQMTFPGAPAVFYGDEIGLSGENDPGCRIAMEWDETRQDRTLFQWYQQLIRLRLSSDSLTEGDFHTILCDDAANVYAFSRSVSTETSLVLLNAGKKPWHGTFPIPAWAKTFTEITFCCPGGNKKENHAFIPEILTDNPRTVDVAVPADSVKIYRFICKK